MPHLTVVFAVLASVSYVVFWILDSIVTNRRIAAKARELGCQDPPEEHFKLPWSIDLVQRALAADKAKVFPSYMQARAEKMGVYTWKMQLFGAKVFATHEPQNIQALLAGQFGNFDLGPDRRGMVRSIPIQCQLTERRRRTCF